MSTAYELVDTKLILRMILQTGWYKIQTSCQMKKLIDILYELVDKMIISKYFYVVVDSEYEQVDKHINLFVPDTTT